MEEEREMQGDIKAEQKEETVKKIRKRVEVDNGKNEWLVQ